MTAIFSPLKSNEKLSNQQAPKEEINKLNEGDKIIPDIRYI